MIRRLASHSHALIAALILATAGPAWAQSAPRIIAVTVSNALSVDMTILLSDTDSIDGLKQDKYTVGAGQSRQMQLICHEHSGCAESTLEIVGLQSADCRARLRLDWDQAASTASVNITKITSTNYGVTRFKCDFQGGSIRTIDSDQGMIYTPNSVLGN